MDITRQDLRSAILAALETILEDEDPAVFARIDDNERLRGQIKIDSLDFLDLVTWVDKTYGYEVPPDDYKQMSSINAMLDYLLPRLSAAKAG